MQFPSTGENGSARHYKTIEFDAQIALAKATTERSACILLDQQQGALRQAIDVIVNQLKLDKCAIAAARIKDLLQYRRIGPHLTEPFRVALVGAPNVGKSSLLNALVGYHREIVYHEPGTTRDVLSVTTAIDGWSCQLFDTAGFRDSEDFVERAGVAKAQKMADRADLVVICVANDQGWSSPDDELLALFPTSLIIGTKADLASGIAFQSPLLKTSALTGVGIDLLLAEIHRRLIDRLPPPGAAVPFCDHQISTLDRVSQFVNQLRPSDAIACLQAMLAG